MSSHPDPSQDEWAAFLDPDDDDPTLDEEDRLLLAQARQTLRDDATWEPIPDSIESRIMAEVRRLEATAGPTETPAEPSSADPTPAAPEPAPAVPSLEDRRAARSARRRWLPAGLAVAASIAAVALAVTQPWAPDEPSGPIEHYALAGTELSPEATSEVEVESLGAGDAITLQITGLPPSPDDHYYAAWVSGPRGTVPVGTFHWREGGIPIELWSGVDTQEYPRLTITIQPEGSEPLPTDQVVMTGTLQP